ASIVMFHVLWLDACMSVIIASLVLYNAARIFKEAFHILMEFAPKRLNIPQIELFIREREGVLDVHDLHICTITTSKNDLLAHWKVTKKAFKHEIARALEKDLREQFELCHITVQLEPPDFMEEAIPF